MLILLRQKGESLAMYRFIIYGKVQGVYYRKFVSSALQKQGFSGYIKNLSDGSVEVVAEVSDKVMNGFLQVLQKGSPLSRVERIEHRKTDGITPKSKKFEIRYDESK